MGIPGLTTFMKHNSTKYFENYELKDTLIIFDGPASVHFLYRQHINMHRTGAFLGNYEIIARTIIDFINLLLRCNVTPIFVFDGAIEQRKIATILQRKTENIQSYGRESMPYFTTGVFFNILNEMDIPHISCDFEADSEIIALAKLFKCPVVSNDSDFYLNTVPYIPLNMMTLKLKSTENVINCKIYNVEKLLKELGELKTDYLPLVGAMLGNDYIRQDTFSMLLRLKPGIFDCRLKLERIAEWLRTQNNVNSAIDNMTNYLFQSNSYIKKQIKKLVQEYNNSINSRYLPFIFQYKMMSKYEDGLKNNLKLNNKKSILPYWLEHYYRRGSVSAEVLTILKLKKILFKVQIENYNQSPYYEISFKIVARILGLLFEKKYSFSVIGRKNGLNISQFNIKPYIYNPYIPLADLNKTDLEYRKNIILNLIGIKNFNGVPKEWELFILVVIYWAIHTRNYKTSHMHALIVSAITFNIINKIETDPQKKTAKNVPNKTKSIIELNIIKVKNEHCIKAMTDLSKYFHVDQYNDAESYSTITHLFAQFQCCINYFMILNSLLDFPYDRCRVEHFFNGPFLYNLCVKMENCNPKAFVSQLFDHSLNSLYNVYKSIINYIEYIIKSVSIRRVETIQNKMGKMNVKQNKKKV